MTWQLRRCMLFEKEAVIVSFKCYNYFKKINPAKGFPSLEHF